MDGLATVRLKTSAITSRPRRSSTVVPRCSVDHVHASRDDVQNVYVTNGDKQMRAVILYNTSWYVFLLRRNLIKALQAAGCEITVVAPEDAYTERVKALGVSFIPISLSPQSTSPLDESHAIASIYRALKRARPHAVLSYTAKCNLYGGLLRPSLRFLQIANVSGLGEGFQRRGLLPMVMRSLYRRALYKCDHVFFQNEEDRAMCVSDKLTDPRSSTVIPGSGVDLSWFAPAPKLMPGPFTFLMFGRLLPKKGFASFMRAAQQLKSRYGDKVSFWILGSADYERPESLALLDHVMQAHAEGSIRYLQSSDDVRPILRDADVVVLPSTYNEGVPRSLLEALACGKVIVTTDWKGCRETVQHGRNGYLVPPHDDRTLERSMARLIEMPEHERQQMGFASRKLAEARFNEKVVVDAYKVALGLHRITPIPKPRRPGPPSPLPKRELHVRAFPSAGHKGGDVREQQS